MTSTTAEVRDEIEALFSWNPPRLVVIPKTKTQTKTSAATRQPAFYYKHFSPDLVVKNVVPLPSLVQDLAKNVDKALDAALGALPPVNFVDFITAQQRAGDMYRIPRTVTNEKAVGDFYDKTTARYCSSVASMLALHPSFPRWRSLLYWTQSPAPSGYASMDGQLCFIANTDDELEMELKAVLSVVDSKVRAVIEEARESMASLATWEMKSVPVGSPEVMAAVRTLGEFKWTSCDDKDCESIPKHVREIEKVYRTAVGRDAQAPPWSLPGEDRDGEINIQPSQNPVTQSAAASGSSTHPLPSSPEHESSMKDTDKKRKRDDDEASEHGPPPEKRNRDDEAYQDRHDTTEQSGSGPSMPLSPTPPPPPSGSKGKGQIRDPDDETNQDPNEKNAQKLVQQAWAQAVRVDGTVIVIHSGNQELVCLRHRQSQTLYVSELIVPSTCSDPGYGKLHIGIYIAAIQDLMDRWQQRAESKPSGDGGDGGSGDGGGDDGGEDQDGQDHSGSGSACKGGRGGRRRRKGRGRGRGGNSGRSRGSSGRKRPTRDELAAIERTMDAASNRDVIHLYLQYDVYDSPIPASFLRSAPSILVHTRCSPPPSSLRALRSYKLEECLTIVVTSEIGQGATGVVHRGTLKPEVLDDAMPLDVVVKLAFDSEQRDALRSEYEVYRHLKSKGVHQGIATALGIFDDSEGCACALVLLYAGVSLSEFQGNLSISDRKSALSTLKSIHGAGTLHGDIRRANILIGDLGVTIIDFGHSKQCDDQEAKDKEMARLRYCLHLEGED